MLKHNRLFFALICACLVASSGYGYADTDYEDLVDVTHTDKHIYAVVGSGKTFALELKGNEDVQWSASRGYLGAFLTNTRFIIISNISRDWQITPLKLTESDNSSAHLSPTLALLVTEDRIVAFDALQNHFVETQIPLRDDVETAKVGDEIAVVVTSSRVFGLGSRGSSFSAVHLKTGETVENIKILSTKAIVRTDDHLLVFVARNPMWRKTLLK